MEKKIKILHLEDSIKDFELMHSIIESGEIKHEYFLTDNEKDYKNILNTEIIDIILSDYNMPDYSGNEALKFAREIFPFIPFIFISGTIGEDAAINAMLNGATDYVLKNKLERLNPAIKRALNETELYKNQKIAEKLLKETDEKFRSIFDQSPVGSLIVSFDSRITKCNMAFCNFIGYSGYELIGKTASEITYSDDVELGSKEMKQMIEGELKTFRLDKRYLRKDGKVVWGDNNFCLVKDANNKPLYFIAVIQDITKRKQSEKELKESEEKLKIAYNYARSLIEASLDPLVTINAEGKITDVNLATENATGLSRDSVIGTDFSDYFTEPEKARIGYQKVFVDGNIIDYPLTIRNKSNRLIDVLYNASVYRNEQGEILGIFATARDITLRKQTELELIKAKEKAEESDRLKSAFLANMSHEIRTPMNGILGFTELLKEPNLSSDEIQDFIQTIQISGERMLNTINSIVDISKIESGIENVLIRKTNINEKIVSIYKFFKPKVEYKRLQFIFKNRLPSEDAIINTDDEKVYGALMNLINNAIKFTNEGSIEFGYVKKGEYLEFFVKDTGIGIPQNQQQIIFERFRQGSESDSRGYEGSGLGLAIAKSYVKLLGGEIWVESEEGKGSIFYFTIPYVVTKNRYPTEHAFSAELNNPGIKKLKILIVDDDEISYLLLKRTLQDISHEVLYAVTGVEAVEACHNNHDLDLILMDLKMPEMDGYEATRQIRKFNRDIIIIAQTAHGFSGEREKVIEAGCNDYMSKPISKTSLIMLICKYFN
jgi:PAS domain S-box-containing protein